MNSSASADPFRFCSSFEGLDPEEQRSVMIATNAYFRAQQREFSPGHELEDWLAAEADIDLLVAGKADPEQTSD